VRAVVDLHHLLLAGFDRRTEAEMERLGAMVRVLMAVTNRLAASDPGNAVWQRDRAMPAGSRRCWRESTADLWTTRPLSAG
jgi:hypothetical protein